MRPAFLQYGKMRDMREAHISHLAILPSRGEAARVQALLVALDLEDTRSPVIEDVLVSG
jgi:hypothetical protein